MAQTLKLPPPRYVIVGEDGPEHSKTFTVEVRVGKEWVSQAAGAVEKERGAKKRPSKFSRNLRSGTVSGCEREKMGTLAPRRDHFALNRDGLGCPPFSGKTPAAERTRDEQRGVPHAHDKIGLRCGEPRYCVCRGCRCRGRLAVADDNRPLGDRTRQYLIDLIKIDTSNPQATKLGSRNI